MVIPVIDLKGLEGDERSQTMSQLHAVCKDWGFFWVDNHGVDVGVMEKVKQFVYSHYEEHLEKRFYESDLAKNLGPETKASEVDWESTYFIQHHPKTNIQDFPVIGPEFREMIDIYIGQLIKLAEKLAESMSRNLGLDKEHIKSTFSPPFVGTKVAMYPPCPRPDLVMGLRAHTDAGGIILLLQDDVVGGLEFFKNDRDWVHVGPTKGNGIFVNIGDQIEVLSNGAYKSILHRVVAGQDGRRLSVATFYNPGSDAVIAPVQKLLYPGPYRFKDYLDYYQGTKFSDKVARFQTVKQMFG